MKIELLLDVRPVKHCPYQLNPRIKDKFKKEIDRMLDTRLIFLVDESNN
jgi:hypothetical protein